MVVNKRRRLGRIEKDEITFTQYRRMCYFADLYPIKVPRCFAFLGIYEHIKLSNIFRASIEEQRAAKKVYCLTGRSKIGPQWYWYSNAFTEIHPIVYGGFAKYIQRIVRRKICGPNLKQRIIACDIYIVPCFARMVKGFL